MCLACFDEMRWAVVREAHAVRLSRWVEDVRVEGSVMKCESKDAADASRSCAGVPRS